MRNNTGLLLRAAVLAFPIAIGSARATTPEAFIAWGVDNALLSLKIAVQTEVHRSLEEGFRQRAYCIATKMPAYGVEASAPDSRFQTLIHAIVATRGAPGIEIEKQISDAISALNCPEGNVSTPNFEQRAIMRTSLPTLFTPNTRQDGSYSGAGLARVLLVSLKVQSIRSDPQRANCLASKFLLSVGEDGKAKIPDGLQDVVRNISEKRRSATGWDELMFDSLTVEAFIIRSVTKFCGEDKAAEFLRTHEGATSAIDEERQRIARQREENDRALAELLRGAWRLPDGRPIFVDASGAWWFTDRTRVPDALAATRVPPQNR